MVKENWEPQHDHVMSKSMLLEIAHISLRLLANPFHSHALLYYSALYTVFLRMIKICLNQIIVKMKVFPVIGIHLFRAISSVKIKL